MLLFTFKNFDVNSKKSKISFGNRLKDVDKIKELNTMVIEAQGYSFVNDIDGDLPLPPAQCLPPLTQVEIARLNEAFSRAKLTAKLSRDCTIKIANQDSMPNHNLTKEQQIYLDYFGTFDKKRAKQIRDNFIKLFNAFDALPEVVDHRNTNFGENRFAATHTKHLTDGEKVRVWIGRDFFAEGKAHPKGVSKDNYNKSYSTTSDATVGTLIHEFSHGVFHAVDAPPLDNTGQWVLNPNLNAGDNYGASPNNDTQCSTREKDKQLASLFPNISLRNADNYGQFACEILLAKQK